MLFLDTNVLLDDAEYFENERFVISGKTLEELENIKNNRNKSEDIKASARKVQRWLADHHGEYEVVVETNAVYDLCVKKNVDCYNPDHIICATAALLAEKEDVHFVTHDLSCRNIAEQIYGLDVEWFEDKEEIYKGYKKITGSTDYINDYMFNVDFATWHINEYLLINNTDDGSIKEMRFDGNSFVPLKLPSSKYIKGKNSLQRCALDMLNNPSITVCAILGNYGSGKTALTMKMATYSVKEKGWQSQILGIREPHGEGKEVGFLPGDLQSKTDFFFSPLVDQLDGGEFEVERMKQQGILEENIPFYLKGRTFNNTCIIVDESEDLTEKQIRLIGTRVGENSRVFFNGDHQQSVVDMTKNNALVKMCHMLKGNEKFACIYLEEDVRSDTSKLFANLFK